MTNTTTPNSPATALSETVNSCTRDEIAKRIKTVVKINGWTQAEAGRLCGQSQPRMSDVLNDQPSRFSLDNLLKIATVLEFHSKEFPADRRTRESALQIIETVRTLVNSRPIKSVHALVTVGSKTVRGGEVVTSSTAIKIDRKSVARVGDLVRYADGSESPIVSGAGYASVYEGKPLAIVGSHIENGDVIESSPQSEAKIMQYADDEETPGFLEIGYEPPTKRE